MSSALTTNPARSWAMAFAQDASGELRPERLMAPPTGGALGLLPTSACVPGAGLKAKWDADYLVRAGGANVSVWTSVWRKCWRRGSRLAMPTWSRTLKISVLICSFRRPARTDRGRANSPTGGEARRSASRRSWLLGGSATGPASLLRELASRYARISRGLCPFPQVTMTPLQAWDRARHLGCLHPSGYSPLT